MLSKKFSELRTYSRRLSAKARMLLAVVCSYVGAQRVYCVPPCDQKRFGDQNSVVGSTSWFLILVGSLQERGEWTEIQGSKIVFGERVRRRSGINLVQICGVNLLQMHAWSVALMRVCSQCESKGVESDSRQDRRGSIDKAEFWDGERASERRSE